MIDVCNLFFYNKEKYNGYDADAFSNYCRFQNLSSSLYKNHANSAICDTPQKKATCFNFLLLSSFIGLYGEMYNHSSKSVCS